MAKGHDIQERTLKFACRIVRLHEILSKGSGARRIVSSQLVRSGTAVGSHLQEADAAESKPDFIYKCSISLKEARESHYWLRVLRGSGVISSEKIDDLVEEANEIIAIITAIVKNARMKT